MAPSPPWPPVAASFHSPRSTSRAPIPLPLPRLGLYPPQPCYEPPPPIPVATFHEIAAPVRSEPVQQQQLEAAVAEMQSLRTWNKTLQACLDVQKLTCEGLKEQLSAKDAAYGKVVVENERLATLAKDVSEVNHTVQTENNALHRTDSALAVADATRLRLALEKETQDHKVTKEERDEARRASKKLRRENIQLRASIDRGEDVRSLGRDYRTGGGGKPVANRTVPRRAKRPVRIPSEEV